MLLINFFPYFIYYITPLCSCRPHWPQDWVSFARWEDASQDLSDPHQEDDISRRPGPGRVHHCQGWPFWSWYQGKHFKGVSAPIIKISKFISPATLYACTTTFFQFVMCWPTETVSQWYFIIITLLLCNQDSGWSVGCSYDRRPIFLLRLFVQRLDWWHWEREGWRWPVKIFENLRRTYSIEKMKAPLKACIYSYILSDICNIPEGVYVKSPCIKQ